MNVIISADEKIINAMYAFSEITKRIPNISDTENKNTLDISALAKEKPVYGDKYRCSEFNYCSHNKSGWILYNTLYNTLVRLTDEEYVQYQKLEFQDDILKQRLLEEGILIRDDIEERRLYTEYVNLYAIFSDLSADITITPTMKCNARCFYCYENGRRYGSMKKENIDKILEFIKAVSNDDHVNLTWFGGEPLMNIPFIDTFCDRLEQEGITFSSFIITNGSLLNDEIIYDKFEKWKICSVQVTLDGTSEEYEKRKNYTDNNEGNYIKIISSIFKIAQMGIDISIRLNVDDKNAENILELVSELEYVFGGFGNVYYYPAFVINSEQNMPVKKRQQFVDDLMLKIKNSTKIIMGRNLYRPARLNSCMKRVKNSYVIDTDGNLYDCEHYVGDKDRSTGNIFDIKNIGNNRDCSVNMRAECKDCVFFPKCLGGCDANADEGDEACMIDRYIIPAYIKLL